MTEKICFRCKKIKPTESFCKSAALKSGLNSSCRQCEAIEYRNYYQLNIERRRQVDRPRGIRKYQKLKQLGHVPTTNEKARTILKQAVRAGRIKKPDSCQDCGALKSAIHLHGHHPDYSKPLEVVWLCSTCHGVKHRRFE